MTPRSKRRWVARLALGALAAGISVASLNASAQQTEPEPAADAGVAPEPAPAPRHHLDFASGDASAPPAPPSAAPDAVELDAATPRAPPSAIEPPPPPPAAEPTSPPVRPRRFQRRREAPNEPERRARFLTAGLYPAVKSGYVSGESTFQTPTGPVTADANTMVLEPHVDFVLIFKELIGVGVSGGYLGALAKGLRGWTLTPFVMVALTPRLSLKGNFGVVEGATNYASTPISATETKIPTSALRYGGGVFYVFFHTRSTRVAVGLELLHMQSATKDNAAYNGTGGFLDLAFSLNP